MIYAIADELTGLIKIGYAGDFFMRLIHIRAEYRQINKPLKLAFLGYIDGDWHDEQHIHFTLHASNVLGVMNGIEWYAPTEDVIDFVLGMRLDMSIPAECLDFVNWGAILRDYFKGDAALIQSTAKQYNLNKWRLNEAMSKDFSHEGRFMCVKLASVLGIEDANLYYPRLRRSTVRSAREEQAS